MAVVNFDKLRPEIQNRLIAAGYVPTSDGKATTNPSSKSKQKETQPVVTPDSEQARIQSEFPTYIEQRRAELVAQQPVQQPKAPSAPIQSVVRKPTTQAVTYGSPQQQAMVEAGIRGPSPEFLVAPTPVNLGQAGYRPVTVLTESLPKPKPSTVTPLTPEVQARVQETRWQNINRRASRYTKPVVNTLFDTEFSGYTEKAKSNPVYMGIQGAEKQVLTDVRDKPVTAAAIYGAGVVVGGAEYGLARGAVSGIKYVAPASKYAQVGMKGAGYVMGGAYGVVKTAEIARAPTAEARGRVVGGAVVEVGAFAGGAATTQLATNRASVALANRAARSSQGKVITSGQELATRAPTEVQTVGVKDITTIGQRYDVQPLVRPVEGYIGKQATISTPSGTYSRGKFQLLKGATAEPLPPDYVPPDKMVFEGARRIKSVEIRPPRSPESMAIDTPRTITDTGWQFQRLVTKPSNPIFTQQAKSSTLGTRRTYMENRLNTVDIYSESFNPTPGNRQSIGFVTGSVRAVRTPRSLTGATKTPEIGQDYRVLTDRAEKPYDLVVLKNTLTGESKVYSFDRFTKDFSPMASIKTTMKSPFALMRPPKQETWDNKQPLTNFAKSGTVQILVQPKTFTRGIRPTMRPATVQEMQSMTMTEQQETYDVAGQQKYRDMTNRQFQGGQAEKSFVSGRTVSPEKAFVSEAMAKPSQRSQYGMSELKPMPPEVATRSANTMQPLTMPPEVRTQPATTLKPVTMQPIVRPIQRTGTKTANIIVPKPIEIIVPQLKTPTITKITVPRVPEPVRTPKTPELIQPPRIKEPGPRPPGLKVPPIPGIIPLPGMSGGGWGKVGKRKRQPKQYTPSAFAASFGVKGKKSKYGELSGLGIRPITK
jgi:hypothetical protein